MTIGLFGCKNTVSSEKNLSDHVANYGQQEILVEQSFVNDYEVKHLVGFSRRHIATRPWHCGVETADVR